MAEIETPTPQAGAGELPAPVPAPAPSSAVRRVALNAFSPFAAQIATKLLMMGYLIVQYRVLGGAGRLGEYFVAAQLFTYTSTVAEWGLGTLLTREVAKRRGDGHEESMVAGLFRETLALRVLISVALFAPVALFVGVYVAFFGLSSAGAVTVAVLTLSLLPGAFSGAVTAVLYAYERMRLPAAIGIATSVVNVALGVGALLLGWGIIGLAGAATATTLVTALIFLRILRRDLPYLAREAAPGTARPGAVSLLKTGWPLMLNALLAGLFFRVDTFIIQPVRGALAVEQYSAAYSFLGFVLLITPAVTLALFPRMARHAATDRPRLALEYTFALKVLLALSAPIVVATVWFAPLLVTVLTAGKPGYVPSSSVALQILIFFLPFSFINGVTQYVLIALDRQAMITRLFGATVAFNIAANLLLVPALGINGAALSTVLSEWVLLVPFLAWTRREIGPVPVAALGLKPLLAALPALAAAWALWPTAERWQANAGALAVYLALGAALTLGCVAVLLALRPFSRTEVKALKGAMRRG